MTNFKKQIFSVMTAGALVLSVSAPAFAGTTIEISGNGAGSDNFVTQNQSNTTSVTQNNTANVTNNVSSDAKTGGNKADFNTGGDTTVDTGAATTQTNVTNTLNSNAAQVGCGTCQGGNTDVTVSNNGSFTQNTVQLNSNNKTTVGQSNTANVTNNVDSDASTGHNKADSNTGGDVYIHTGAASTTTNVTTKANANNAVVGGGNGASNPTATFKIVGNGAGSDNYIKAGLNQSATVTQNNFANVKNDVDSYASSGGNKADFNTNGDVTIDTGAASTNVGVDNMVNFNNASLNCGCGWDVLAKIDNNGAGVPWLEGLGAHNNTITLGLNNTQTAGQGNNAYLNNYLNDQDAMTGFNHASLNTGAANMSDPTVHTGAADSTVNVNNSGNVNTIGNALPITWPFGNVTVGANFDWSAFFAMFGVHVS